MTENVTNEVHVNFIVLDLQPALGTDCVLVAVYRQS